MMASEPKTIHHCCVHPGQTRIPHCAGCIEDAKKPTIITCMATQCVFNDGGECQQPQLTVDVRGICTFHTRYREISHKSLRELYVEASENMMALCKAAGLSLGLLLHLKANVIDGTITHVEDECNEVIAALEKALGENHE